MSKRKRIIALLVGGYPPGRYGRHAGLAFGYGRAGQPVRHRIGDAIGSGNAQRQCESDVKAQNTGTAPAYIRAAVDIYWQDGNGARLWEEPKEEPKEEADYEIAWSVADASDTNSADNWVKGRATGSITGRRPLLPAVKPACSLIELPSSRQPKVAILSLISPLRRSRRRPMRPCTMHGTARSMMACWCRRMEVRKYGVPNSQRCCALLALHGRGHFLRGRARCSRPCVCRYSRDCL